MLKKPNKKSIYYKETGRRTGKTYLCIDDEDWYRDPNFEPNICPFCYEETFSGSWIIEKCINCGAICSIGRWTKEIGE